MARLSLKQLLQWAKHSTLFARSFFALASPKWSANSSPRWLLQLQNGGELDPIRLRMVALAGFAICYPRGPSEGLTRERTAVT